MELTLSKVLSLGCYKPLDATYECNRFCCCVCNVLVLKATKLQITWK